MKNRLIPWLIVFLVAGNAPVESLTSYASGSDWLLPKARIFNRFRELLPDIGIPNIGRVQIKPSGKFGYRRVGWKAEIPIPYTFVFNDSADVVGDYYTIKPKEVDLWVGEASVQAEFSSGFAIFTTVSGTFCRALSTTGFLRLAKRRNASSGDNENSYGWRLISV